MYKVRCHVPKTQRTQKKLKSSKGGRRYLRVSPSNSIARDSYAVEILDTGASRGRGENGGS